MFKGCKADIEYVQVKFSFRFRDLAFRILSSGDSGNWWQAKCEGHQSQAVCGACRNSWRYYKVGSWWSSRMMRLCFPGPTFRRCYLPRSSEFGAENVTMEGAKREICNTLRYWSILWFLTSDSILLYVDWRTVRPGTSMRITCVVRGRLSALILMSWLDTWGEANF